MTKVNTKLGDCTRIIEDLAISLGFRDCSSIDVSELEDSRETAFRCKTADEFAFWYLKSEVFSKFKSPEGGEALRQSAYRKFHQAEQSCRETTPRLVGPLELNPLFPNRLIPTMKRAKRIIKEILGEFDLEELPSACGWGPGASKELARRLAHPSNKWELASHVTSKALPYAMAFFRWSGLNSLLGANLDYPDAAPVMGERFFQIDEANRVTTVPKSYKTDRTIAIEPAWNSFMQKGLGRMIRRRLRRRGMLTPDAQTRNRLAARAGSIDGSLATIDLSMASDSICVALCELLLPPAWLRLVLDLRCEVGELEGVDGLDQFVFYEKVSSMGCGFTFELETLLFYALTLAASEKGNASMVRTYGDDIICCSDDAEAVLEILSYCGFSANREKTFITGPFRESCGGHYWKGEDVTPFYVKEVPHLMSQVIDLSNKLIHWSSQRVSAEWRDLHVLFRETWKLSSRRVPKALRGPWNMAGVLWSEWDTACPAYVPDYQSWRVHSCMRSQRKIEAWDRVGGLVCALHNNAMDRDDDVLFSQRFTAKDRDVIRHQWVPSARWPMLPVSWLCM